VTVPRAIAALVTTAALSLLAGCGSPPATPPSPTSPPAPSASTSAHALSQVTSPQPATSGRTVTAASARPTKVLVIVEENHTATSALRGMPYLASMAKRYGYTSSRAVAHPSLPNYLALAGGSTFGVTDDRSPASHRIEGPSVFDRAIAAHRSAKTYAEAMPAPCFLSATDRYAVKHNPWAYFSDPVSRAHCRKFDVPSGTAARGPLRSDVNAGRLPEVGMLVPDICHDAHDCSLGTADDWLRQWLRVVLAARDYRSGRLAIVVTFDEDDTTGSNHVLTTVISPYTSHVVSSAPYTHYSLTRYLAEIAGAPPLRAASTAPSLRAAFHI
jgi:hypothetical protein